MNKHPSGLWRIRARLWAGILGLMITITAEAGVRLSSDFSRTVDPNLPNPHLRGRGYDDGGGVFLAAGGVQYILEEVEGTRLVPSRAIRLRTIDHSTFAAEFGDRAFAYQTHREIICPLSRMTIRGGELVFSMPPSLNSNRMTARGLEQVPSSQWNQFNVRRIDEISQSVDQMRTLLELLNQRGLDQSLSPSLPTIWIAKEFSRTRFYPLLGGADFARVSELPASLVTQLKSGMQLMIGRENIRGSANNGSYFNSDAQVRYRAYLNTKTMALDVEGVPLRYTWTSDSSGRPTVTQVSVLALSVGQPMAVTQSMRTQTDFLVLWQTAAIFREANRTDSGSFSEFSSSACSL